MKTGETVIMASDNNSEIMNALLELPKEELIKKYITSVNKIKEENAEQMAAKNALIAELSQGREKTEEDRKKILAVARDEAASIVAKAHNDLEKAEETAQQKIDAAGLKADSIVESRLTAAQESIEKLEGERLDTKNQVMSFLDNVVAEYDEIIERVEKQLSTLKDSRQSVIETKKTINLEQFTRFAISDYVTVANEAKKSAAEAVKDVTDTAPVEMPSAQEEAPQEPVMVGLRTPAVQTMSVEDTTSSPAPKPTEETQEPFGDLADLFDDGDEAQPQLSKTEPTPVTSEEADDDFDIEFEDFADFADFEDDDEEEAKQIDIPEKQQNPGRSRWINT